MSDTEKFFLIPAVSIFRLSTLFLLSEHFS